MVGGIYLLPLTDQSDMSPQDPRPGNRAGARRRYRYKAKTTLQEIMGVRVRFALEARVRQG